MIWRARKIISAGMFVINIGLTACLLYLFLGRGYFVVGGFTSVELVTIVLAALSVLLTALGIFIALLAIWGYQSLRYVSEETARTTAENVVNSELPALVKREFAEVRDLKDILGQEQVSSTTAQEAVNSLDGGKQ